jgi:large-conductance mechanosensitive channel
VLIQSAIFGNARVSNDNWKSFEIAVFEKSLMETQGVEKLGDLIRSVYTFLIYATTVFHRLKAAVTIRILRIFLKNLRIFPLLFE